MGEIGGSGRFQHLNYVDSFRKKQKRKPEGLRFSNGGAVVS